MELIRSPVKGFADMSTKFIQQNAPPTVMYFRKPVVENPFVEVSDSVLLLARIVIATTLVYGWGIGLFGEGAAPNKILRLFCFTFYLGVQTLPLWWKLPKMGILHPLFLISAYSFMKDMIPSLSLSVLGLSFHPFMPSVGPSGLSIIHIQVMLLYATSLIFTYLGYYSSVGIKWKFIRFRGDRSVLVGTGIICFIVGLTAFYLLTELSGGFYLHLKNIARGSTAKLWVQDATNASTYVTLCRLLTIPPALWMLAGKKNPVVSPGFWLTAITALSVGYLTAGRRSGMIGVVVILVACWILRSKKVAIGRLGVIWTLLFLSIGILGEYRRTNWDGSSRVNTEAFSDTTLTDAFKKSMGELQGRKSNAPIYLIVDRVPYQVPYLYGSNYLAWASRFIPRRFWPEKPVGYATQCAEVFYGRYNSGAIPMGAVGEAFWSGGWFIIPIVFLIWGRCLRSIGNFFLRFRHSAFACLLYFLTITRLQPDELGFGGWVYMVIPTCAILMLMGEIKFGKLSR